MSIKITESVIATIPNQELVSLRESANKTKALPDRIVTVVEAIHSGLTRNHTFYPGHHLEKSVPSWTAPYEKPVIKNHDVNQEPLGRVLSAAYKKSNIAEGQYTIELELEITDPDAIKKVLDGRYRTLSIGGSTNSAVCSVCQKDLVKEGYCGHMKGRTYEGKQAFWTIGEMEFEEISWVNVPADRNAQVVQRNTVIQTQESSQTEGGIQEMDDHTQNILDQIDSLRTAEGTEPEATPDTTIEEGTQTAESTPVATEDTPPASEEGAAVAESITEEELAELKRQLETLQTENTTLVAEKATLETEKATAVAEQETLQAEVTRLTDALAAAEEEGKGFMEKSVTLAGYAHRAIAEGVLGLEVVLGKVEESDKETRLDTLAKETSRSLKEQMTTLMTQKPQRQLATVDNPGLMFGSEDESTGKPQEQKKEITIVDLAESLTKVFNKQN